jgi:hypothetical protein
MARPVIHFEVMGKDGEDAPLAVEFRGGGPGLTVRHSRA